VLLPPPLLEINQLTCGSQLDTTTSQLWCVNAAGFTASEAEDNAVDALRLAVADLEQVYCKVCQDAQSNDVACNRSLLWDEFDITSFAVPGPSPGLWIGTACIASGSDISIRCRKPVECD
jgi:hypothetical protein